MAYKDPEKQREYQRQWVAKRRAAFFADKVCTDCGATEDLELDHRDPAEKVHHAIWSWSEERRLEEIAKCDVRCTACHHGRHDPLRIQHGTRKRYRKGCRCNLCRLAEANYGAKMRERRRQEAA